MTTKQNIVIVGGGGAGNTIAKALSAKLDASRYQLIVINPRPFELFYPALIRTVVTAEGRVEDGALNPISKVFANGNGTVKLGHVARVEHAGAEATGGRVVLEDGEVIEFAVLVLAPGSVWEGPLVFPDTREEVDKHLADWRAKFKDAKHIVLAGGGAVGIGALPPSTTATCACSSSPVPPQKWPVKSKTRTRSVCSFIFSVVRPTDPCFVRKHK